MRPGSRLYTFIDEGGNLDFSPTGTRYFTLTSVTTEHPLAWSAKLTELKYELIDQGSNIEFFHASEDSQAVRDRVFAVIGPLLDLVRIDCVIVEKARTPPAARHDEEFYPKVLGRLVHYVASEAWNAAYSELVVFTDALPIARKRRAVEKAVKTALATSLPAGVRYRIMHHASKSSVELQVADYCNWAVFRKWERNDARSYQLISGAVKSEFVVFEKAVRDGVQIAFKYDIHGPGREKHL